MTANIYWELITEVRETQYAEYGVCIFEKGRAEYFPKRKRMDSPYAFWEETWLSSNAGKEFFHCGLSVPGMCKMYRSDDLIYCGVCHVLLLSVGLAVLHRILRYYVLGLAYTAGWNQRVHQYSQAYYRTDWRIWMYDIAIIHLSDDCNGDKRWLENGMEVRHDAGRTVGKI